MSESLPASKEPNSISKAGPISASTLVCMIMKTDRIELHGFNKPQAKWFAPGVKFVSVSQTGRNDIGAEIAWQSQRTRKTILASVVILAVFLLIAGLISAMLSSQSSPLDRAALRPMAWSPVRVTDSGVLVRSGPNEIHIPTGHRLPNGEMLLSVSRDRSSYATPNGTTTLTK